jgi:hypothetical protein
MTRTPPACDMPGQHRGRIRFFVCGHRCAAHTPAALAGKAEAPEPAPKEQK